MKIIDLLNKIANGEEMPKKILIRFNTGGFGEIFEYSSIYKDYYEETGDRLFEDYDWLKELNTEVEIPEDNKNIEKIIPTSLKGIDNLDEKIEIAHIDTISAMDKINELIDEVNKLKNER